MSDFELVDEGEGRFAVKGDLSFATANALLRKSENLFAGHQSLAIDLSAVQKSDSAGLALIIEWKSQAAARQAAIRIDSAPDSLVAIAKTCEVEDLL